MLHHMNRFTRGPLLTFIACAVVACLVAVSFPEHSAVRVQAAETDPAAAHSVKAFPAEIKLDGAGAHALLVFQNVAGDVIGQQVTEGIEITIADATIAT